MKHTIAKNNKNKKQEKQDTQILFKYGPWGERIVNVSWRSGGGWCWQKPWRQSGGRLAWVFTHIEGASGQVGVQQLWRCKSFICTW